MKAEDTHKEYQQRINTVINYILNNLKEDLSLDKLAAIANYSPFHFQKVFSQVQGESPKQYIIRMRLENAAHYLNIHSHKSITEIALDSGFASAATFARAFKNYFGVSAEGMRALTPTEKVKLRQNQAQEPKPDFLTPTYDTEFWSRTLQVVVRRIPAMRTLFVNTPWADTQKIQEGFGKVVQWVESHDLFHPNTIFVGLGNPHQGLYRSSVSIPKEVKLPSHVSETMIEAGKFAVYKIKGDTVHTFQSLHAFYEIWLPHSGYRIADPNGFEILLGNPATIPYVEIEREIHIRIEPAN